MHEKNYSRNGLIAGAFLFALSYILLYFLSLAGFLKSIPFIGLLFPLHSWDSPTYFLIPIAGFFFVFLVIDWINHYFETKIAFSWFFVLLFIVLCLSAFYVNLFFFFYPVVQKNAKMVICLSDESACNNLQQSLVQKYQSKGIPVLLVKYWNELRNTSFVYFMLAGILGWISNFTLRKLTEKQFI